MRVIDCKNALSYKIAGGRKLPDDEVLSNMFVEAILWVANKCVPAELLKQSYENCRVYRNIENGFFIRIPEKPNFSDENTHLMIDESLNFAVINYVAYLIEQNEAYRRDALEIINEYNANSGREMMKWIN